MDYTLFHFFNQYADRWSLLDSVAVAVAKYGPLLYLVPLLWLWFKGRDEQKKTVLLAGVSVGVALLAAQVIIAIYFRERPFAFHEVNLLLDRSPDASFPSDHATFSFAIAWMILFQNRRWGIGAVVLGVAISLARVFAGTHYPLDVTGGALLGLAAAALVWRLRTRLDPVTSFLIAIARKIRLA
ncbi:MAG: phosphatase PAP2 family protein [Thermoleophilia bacterium]